MAAFKEMLNADAVNDLADGLKRVEILTRRQAFVDDVISGLSRHELKGRVTLIANAIAKHSRLEFVDTVARFPQMLAPVNAEEWNSTTTSHDQGLSGFIVWPLTEYVSSYGLDEIEASLAALKELTRRFTSEFAIRSFLIHHRDRTMKYLVRWAKDDCEHVRRLVSEGTRPRLPWGVQLVEFVKNPSLTEPLLNALWDDSSEYVRRSVANHVNDIAKDHPDVALKLVERWRNENRRLDEKAFRSLAHRALRTLVKAGHRRSLGLLGFQYSSQIHLIRFRLKSEKVRLGGVLEATLTIRNLAKRPMKVMLDYAIHHVRKSGRVQAKVFKFRVFELKANETRSFELKHPFERITTRRYYSGVHRIEVLSNGKCLKSSSFRLDVS